MSILPDVPTVAESGLPDYNVITWNGMAAPRATPRAVIDRLNAEVHRAMASPDVRDRLLPIGVEPAPGTPEQLREMLTAETALWGRVIEAARIEKQ